jgi:hypothetical protein
MDEDKLLEILKRLKSKNRSSKIDSIINNKDYKEKNLTDDIEFKKFLNEFTNGIIKRL